MNCRHDEVPHNVTLLYLPAKAYQVQRSNTETLEGSPWYTTWSQKVSQLLLCQGSMCGNTPQTISSNDQQGCNNIVQVVTMHCVVHSLV